MRWIYLSPHLDDAVLSCGGLIWEQTHHDIPVEIWTVNAGDPPPGPVSDFITVTHFLWGTGTPQETVDLRRAEDKNAASIVGAKTRHLTNVDALYRRSATGSLIYTLDIFVPIDPVEAGIVEHVAARIAGELNETDIVVCPLGLGKHVDHIITRKAIESLGRLLLYYADIPYLFTHEDELQAAVNGMTPKTYAISDDGLTAWENGIAAYRSQISTLFKDLQDMRAHLRDYRTSKQGLTLWKQV